jgi:hypothetical protein
MLPLSNLLTFHLQSGGELQSRRRQSCPNHSYSRGQPAKWACPNARCQFTTGLQSPVTGMYGASSRRAYGSPSRGYDSLGRQHVPAAIGHDRAA